MNTDQLTEAEYMSATTDREALVAPLHATPKGETQSHGLPIRILRKLELFSLQSDYASFRKQETEDAWMFVQEGKAMGPVSFHEILNHLLDGQSPLSVIHESRAYEEQPYWSELVYKPVWKNPIAATAWAVGFWIMAASVGFILLRFLLPSGIRTFGSVAYSLLAMAAAYFQTRPHHAAWSAKLRSPRMPH